MRKPFIMVVDDNRITTKLLRRYLEATGLEATEAYDGIDCLEKVKERYPDAIVLDVMMPRMDGYETVKKLKGNAATEHIPVVIVTALNDVANQIKSIEAGSDDFLSKPIEEKLLIAKVSLLSKWHLEKSKADALESYINSGGSGKSPKEIYEEAGI
ncbi:MAG: response regulator [Candidatus Kapabacteria bacterium]|jgi:CheY-like chemotaxis protein|nr:response regulator [Candidatus Kapabacteria bacterium]